MIKLIKNSIIVMAISVAIVGTYAPTTAFANGGEWRRDSVGWWYRNSDGSYPTNRWERIGGKWYYFDGRGYIIHSRWELISGHWYYFNTSGHMIENTWKMIDNKWYYFDTKGHMLLNQWVGDYYLGETGAMLKSTVTPDNYVVGSDGKWDRRFSRELAEKAKNQAKNWNLYKARYSKYSAAYQLVLSDREAYNIALHLIEIIYPEYKPVDNAKRAIKYAIEEKDKSDNPYDWMSKDSLIKELTNSEYTSYYRFSAEEVKKAFSELSHEIDFPKFFRRQAIKALKNIDSYSQSSKAYYESTLAKNGFTEEEIDNALKVANIDFVHNATQKSTTSCTTAGSKCTTSKESTIRNLVKYDGFTREEAEEGVNRLNYDFKINLRNLLDSNFTTTNASWAGSASKEFIVDHVVRNDLFEASEVRAMLTEYNINYTERAKLRAMNILKNNKYSKDGLVRTLVDYWKFTKEEATNAVKDLKHENLID